MYSIMYEYVAKMIAHLCNQLAAITGMPSLQKIVRSGLWSVKSKKYAHTNIHETFNSVYSMKAAITIPALLFAET